MNRNIILGNPNGTCDYVVPTGDDFMSIGEGNVALFDCYGKAVSTEPEEIADGGIQIVGGRKPGFHPLATPLLGNRGISYKVAYPKPGVHFSSTLVFKNVDADAAGVLTVLLSNREDPIPNERYKWTVDVYTDGKDTLEGMANAVAKQFNLSYGKNLSVKATVVDVVINKAKNETYKGIKFEAIDDNFDNWAIVPGNNLMYAPVVEVVAGHKAFLDAKHIIELLRDNAAEEGFEYPAGNLSEMYPGYNNSQLAPQYARLYIRAYTPKQFATVDEPLWTVTNLFFPYVDEPAVEKTKTVNAKPATIVGGGKPTLDTKDKTNALAPAETEAGAGEESAVKEAPLTIKNDEVNVALKTMLHVLSLVRQ